MIQPNGPIALGSNALRATVNAQGGLVVPMGPRGLFAAQLILLEYRTLATQWGDHKCRFFGGWVSEGYPASLEQP